MSKNKKSSKNRKKRSGHLSDKPTKISEPLSEASNNIQKPDAEVKNPSKKTVHSGNGKEDHASGHFAGKALEFTKLIVSTLLAVFIIRTFLISTYQIPTGSMEDTLLTGDHIIANKFVFSIRTPDWIGIPYTRIGFHTPFVQLPGFRKPKKGDIVIFKYPEDTWYSYVKRCIAVSGDTLEVRDKEVYVNGVHYPNAPDGKFIEYRTFPKNAMQSGIFPPGAGNKDNYGPVRIPAVGDTFQFTRSNREKWYERLVIMAYEGNKIEFQSLNGRERFEPTNVIQEKREWRNRTMEYSARHFLVNGTPLDKYTHQIRYRHYFMMGDNRDNSLDSRYWGFVPQRLVLGEPIVIYWSWNKYKVVPFIQIFKKVRWSRFLRLVH